MIKSEKQKLGAILKQARKDQGFTQSQVAEKLGVTFQAISNYERGTNNVDNDTLEKLCTLYKIPYQQTFDSIDYQTIAKKLKAERTRKKLTQAQVSKFTGIPVSTIRSYESGKTEIPISDIQLLCGAYLIEVNSIIKENHLFFRFTNLTVFMDIKAEFAELAKDLREIADEVEHLIDGEDDQLREISIKFKIDITEHF